MRTTLAEAQRALVLGEPDKAKELVDKAASLPLGAFGRAAKPGLADAKEAVAAEDPVALEIARAATWTAILAEAASRAVAAAAAGDVDEARALAPRSRVPHADTLHPAGCRRDARPQAWSRAAWPQARPRRSPRRPLRHVPGAPPGRARRRRDARPSRTSPCGCAGAASLARGYFAILEPAYAKQRSAGRGRRDDRPLRGAGGGGPGAGSRSARRAPSATIDEALEGFRAAPLSEEEQLRRAGQLQRFLALVPIEYGRGVDDGRVTLDFEIQEAVTFRDGAAQALGDLEHLLAEQDQQDTKRLGELLDGLGGRPRRGRPAGRRRRSRRHPGRDRRGARADRLAVSRQVEGGRGDRRLRRDLRHARPARGRHRRRAVRPGRAGTARGLRVLRVRPRAAAPRSRLGAVRRGRGALLVRRGRPAGPRAAREAQGLAGGGGRDPPEARRGAGGRGGGGRRRARPRRSRSSRTPRSSSSGKGSRPC